jgi:hypothetical protein
VTISHEIADLFLAAWSHRTDAHQRAQTLTARLKDCQEWQAEEIEEVRRLIAEGLHEREARLYLSAASAVVGGPSFAVVPSFLCGSKANQFCATAYRESLRSR